MNRVILAGIAVLLALFVSLIAPGAPPTARAESKLDLDACTLTLGADPGVETPARCGTFQVPEDWSQPDGRQITLRVAVLPALSPNPRGAPIFHFEGGPGASAIEGYSTIWHSAYEGFRADHDIVLIDQRGTGGSTSLQCTEFTSSALDDLAKGLSPEQRIEQSRERYTACLNRLAATTDPAQYTTAALADDTDAVRAALGYDQINIFGSSYGTWLGQIYLARHGDHVNAAVLEGTVGPWNEHVLSVGQNIQDTLYRVFDLCAADADCNRTYPDLRTRLDEAVQALSVPAKALGISAASGQSYAVVITRDDFLGTLQALLDTGSSVATIPKVVTDAARGQFTTPATIMVALAEQADSVSLGMFQSIICAESLAYATPDDIQKAMDGSFYGTGDAVIESLIDGCRVWRSGEVDPADIAPARSDRPVLILAGGFDSRTPVAYAEEADARLSRSTLAVFPYQGHGILPFSGCAQQLAAQFFLTPDAPLDVSCAAQDTAPRFQGAVQLQFERYNDPAGAFRVNIPLGWQRQPDPAGSDTQGMAFFQPPESEGARQILGIGAFGAVSADEAQRRAEAVIAARFGAVNARGALDVFGMKLIEYSARVGDDIGSGALIIIPAGGSTRVIWYAAPPNVFVSVFENIVVGVTPSLQ
ncbi:MAG: alpha/beta fold hydrolase [Anaerolineae bacterium]|nr:alpha/beta fold hydrolase [Anaerolineae bacterium]